MDTQEIDQIAERVAFRVNGKGTKRILGLEIGAYTRMLISMLVAAGLAFGAWYLAVRDGLKARPTIPEAEAMIERHEERGRHPAIDARIQSIEQEQRVIRESQVRQEQIDEVQTKMLDEIRDDVKKLRRRR